MVESHEFFGMFATSRTERRKPPRSSDVICFFRLQIGFDEFSLGGWTTPTCALARPAVKFRDTIRLCWWEKVKVWKSTFFRKMTDQNEQIRVLGGLSTKLYIYIYECKLTNEQRRTFYSIHKIFGNGEWCFLEYMSDDIVGIPQLYWWVMSSSNTYFLCDGSLSYQRCIACKNRGISTTNWIFYNHLVKL